MTTDEIREQIEALGGEVPTEGTGKDGAVVKADLEGALEALEISREGDILQGEGLPEGTRRTRNGNLSVRH